MYALFFSSCHIYFRKANCNVWRNTWSNSQWCLVCYVCKSPLNKINTFVCYRQAIIRLIILWQQSNHSSKYIPGVTNSSWVHIHFYDVIKNMYFHRLIDTCTLLCMNIMIYSPVIFIRMSICSIKRGCVEFYMWLSHWH